MAATAQTGIFRAAEKLIGLNAKPTCASAGHKVDQDLGRTMNVGFIGLGIMGAPMALNILKADHKLTVYNRTPAKAQPLFDAGARLASAPQEFGDVDLLIT